MALQALATAGMCHFKETGSPTRYRSHHVFLYALSLGEMDARKRYSSSLCMSKLQQGRNERAKIFQARHLLQQMHV